MRRHALAGLALLLGAAGWCSGYTWRRATPDDRRIGALLALTAVHRAQEAAAASDARAGRPGRARTLDGLVSEGHLPALPEAQGYRLEVGLAAQLPFVWRGVATPLEPGLPWCGVGDHEAFWGPRPIPLDPLAPRPDGGVALELLARPPGPSGWFGGR